MHQGQTQLSISAKYLAPYCCLAHTISLSCTRMEISILKQKKKKSRYLIRKQIGTVQKQAGFQEPNTCIFLPSFVLSSVCANLVLSILSNNVCLFHVNQLQHLWDEQQLHLYGLTAPQIPIIHVELCFGKFLLLPWLQTR